MEEGKFIELKRHYSQSDLAQSDPEVKEWLDSSYKSIGPYWSNKASGSGLSFEEKKLLMPKVHSVDATDKDFRKVTDLYFDEITTIIPAGGKRLQIGLEDDSKPLSEDNLPIDIKDYIAYRHAMKHPSVAKNEGEASALIYKKFYVHDQEASVDSQEALVKLEDEASEIYFDLKSDISRVEQILSVMGIPLAKLNKKEKLLQFKALARMASDKEPALEAIRLKNFIKVATSKDLELEYLITELISAQVLERIGTNIVVAETNASVGNGMREAVLFLKDAKNSKTLLFLKNKFGTLVKKGEPTRSEN